MCVSDLLFRPKCAYLGVCFSLDSEISVKHNFEKRLLALEKCLNIWSSRDLTLNRKIYVYKTFQKPNLRPVFTDWSIVALYILQFKVTAKNTKTIHILYVRDKLFGAKIIKSDECQ